jgi:hypothetical protein
MFAPNMMSTPTVPTYPAPAYVPRQSPPYPPRSGGGRGGAAAPAQPKPVIRAQAPEEARPIRPPLLSLPSPEQLGVAVRPVENGADWSELHARMKQLGVLSFHMDSLPDGRSRFTCWIPGERPDLTRRIESVAANEIEAVQRGLHEAAHASKR